jgi:plastocyanin
VGQKLSSNFSEFLAKFMVKEYATSLIMAALFSCLILPSAQADQPAGDTFVLTLKDHKFDPQQLVVPAGKKFTLTVKNLDATPSEFESNDLDREKVVKAGAEITVFLGPLDAGTYNFFDDFHRDTTTGTLKAQ